jgi:hypothetical protein
MRLLCLLLLIPLCALLRQNRSRVLPGLAHQTRQTASSLAIESGPPNVFVVPKAAITPLAFIEKAALNPPTNQTHIHECR